MMMGSSSIAGLFDFDDKPRLADYYYQRRQQRRKQAALPPKADPTIEPSVKEIASTDNLLDVYEALKRDAGKAPGPDGFTYSSWGRSEVAQIMRELTRTVLKGSYSQQPCRQIRIPKTDGRHRTLSIRNLCDRVLSAALNGALTPFWEKIFLPQSMGFRPGRSTWHVLAELDFVMPTQNRWVLAIDDVKQAFDNVNIDIVMDLHRQHLKDAELLGLVEAVLRGSKEEKKSRGIDQGSAYSPTALNVLLHHAHDLGMNQGQIPPWYRYADNLVYVCQDVSEGSRVLDHSRRLLEKVNLTLKGEDGPPVYLRYEEPQLLGFKLYHKVGNHLGIGPGQSARDQLVRNLLKAHETENPPEAAIRTVNGWINAYGPAFESWRAPDLLTWVLDTAASKGFREINSYGILKERQKEAWGRWLSLKKRVQQSLKHPTGPVAPSQAVAPPAVHAPGA
jgi:hypothetical protein